MTLKWKWKSWRVVWRGAVAAMILAVAGTWVWSYWYREKLGYLTESGAAFLATAERGQLFLGWRDMEATHPITTGTGMLRMRLPTDPYLIISTCAMGWVGSLEFDQAIMNTFGSTFSKRTGIGWFWSARSGTRPAGAPVAELSGLFGGSAVGIQTPFWLLMAALLVPAAITGVRRRKQRRPGEGLPCRKCGYDLRATPERCPECGEAAGT